MLLHGQAANLLNTPRRPGHFSCQFPLHTTSRCNGPRFPIHAPPSRNNEVRSNQRRVSPVVFTHQVNYPLEPSLSVVTEPSCRGQLPVHLYSDTPYLPACSQSLQHRDPTKPAGAPVWLDSLVQSAIPGQNPSSPEAATATGASTQSSPAP